MESCSVLKVVDYLNIQLNAVLNHVAALLTTFLSHSEL